MAKKIKKMLSLVVALCICVSVLPLQALAVTETSTTTETSPEGLPTDVTTTTTTETDAEGNTTIKVTIEKETDGTLANGVELDRTETQIDTTIQGADGSLTEKTETKGSETKEWTQDIASGTKVDVPLEEGKSNSTDSAPEMPAVSADTTLTANLGQVTVTNKDVSIEETVVEKVVDENGKVIEGNDLDYAYNEDKPVQADKNTGRKDNELVVWIYRGNRTELPAAGEDIEVKAGFEYKYLGGGVTSQYLPVYLYGEPASEDEEPVYVDAEGNKYYVNDQGVADYDKSFVGGEMVELEESVPGTFSVTQQFILVDAATGELITTYCADAATPTQKGFNYYIENVEDADYYSDEQAAMIRTIAKNGYWGAEAGEEGSLENMKEMMRNAKDEAGNAVFTEDEVEMLSEGMALAVTQMSIWTFSNSANDMNFYSALYTKEGTNGELKTSYASQLVNKNADKDDAYALLYKLYDHMINLDPTPADPKEPGEVIMNADNFLENMSVTVIEKAKDHDNNADENTKNDAYVTDISFALVVTPSTANGDDMIVKILDANGDVIAQARIAGEAAEGEKVLTPDASGNYTFKDITLVEGDQTFRLTLEGIQNLKQGVYLYTSEIVSDEEGDTSSQTLVGFASGKHAVDLSMNLTFTLDVEDDLFVTERVWSNAGDPTYTPGEPEQPEQPEEPEQPEQPEQPEEPEQPDYTTPIPDTRVPYAPAPAEARLINDDDTVTIEEEEVPLAATPETGDMTALWIVMIVVAAVGLCAYNVYFKKQQKVF